MQSNKDLRSIAVVGGFASGKTTLANSLVENYGFTRISLAAKLKWLAAQVYSNGIAIDKQRKYTITDIDDGYDYEITGRTLLQNLGQSVKQLDRDFWIRWLASDLREGRCDSPPWVIDDCRFTYEADWLADELGFIIVKLIVPDEVRMARYKELYGVEPGPGELLHPSEKNIDLINEHYLIDGTRPPEEVTALVMDIAIR